MLNREPFRNAKILLAGPNFGCGSSRETAVMALVQFGIRCVIATGFGTIFHGNSWKHGLLPISLPLETVKHLASQAERNGVALPMTVSLVDNTITTSGGEVVRFEIAEFRRHALLEGLDDISVTLERAPEIRKFEERDKRQRPWIYA